MGQTSKYSMRQREGDNKENAGECRLKSTLLLRLQFLGGLWA